MTTHAAEQRDDLTVVIPTYNRRRELVRALDALAAQTDPDFDVIVCDDGSTEDIAAAVSAFEVRLRLRLIRIDNSGGPARPRNVAARAATTRWISFLDSDDWWWPSRMAHVRQMLSDDWDLVYHPLIVERADGDRTARPAHGSRIGEPLRTTDPLLHMIRFGNPFPTSGTTVRREAMLAIGGFSEHPDLVSVEDFDAWLRLAAQGARVRPVTEPLGCYWVGAEHISHFDRRQFERQQCLFQRQLALLPPQYQARARSNFAYLLGSYALELGLADHRAYLSDVRLTHAPLRWLKARFKTRFKARIKTRIQPQ